jgi:histidinol-phosphate aminotransferase
MISIFTITIALIITMNSYLALKERGILVRHFDSDRIKEYNRITIGSKDEMVQFIKTVKEIIGK